MSRIIGVVALFAFAGGARSSASAQPDLLRVAAQHVQRHELNKHIFIDPRIMPVQRLDSFGMVPCRTEQPLPLPAFAHCVGLLDSTRLTIDSPRHPDSALAELQEDSSITVMTRDRAAVCGGAWNAECRTNGPEYFVRFTQYPFSTTLGSRIRGNDGFYAQSHVVCETERLALGGKSRVPALSCTNAKIREWSPRRHCFGRTNALRKSGHSSQKPQRH